MTFYEVRARTIINQVPPASRMAFRWTINPYRGCSHACTYCFARNTHTYLDLDAGADFNARIVVKVNAAELARKELAAPRWRGEHVAMGTNVDCYQRAEGRYRLMPGIITALREAANPFSILTKGTLILRDLDLLAEAAEVTEVGLNVSVGSTDPGLCRSVEPGTPSPQRRLEACAAITAPRPALRRADGPRAAVPVRLPRPAGGDRPADRRGRRGARQPDRAAPAARRPRVVPALARRAAPGARAPLPGAVRNTRVRAPRLPAAHHRAGAAAGRAARRRPGQPGPGPPRPAGRPAGRGGGPGRGRRPARPFSYPCSDQL